jgi:hypothetical protein
MICQNTCICFFKFRAGRSLSVDPATRSDSAGDNVGTSPHTCKLPNVHVVRSDGHETSADLRVADLRHTARLTLGSRLQTKPGVPTRTCGDRFNKRSVLDLSCLEHFSLTLANGAGSLTVLNEVSR